MSRDCILSYRTLTDQKIGLRYQLTLPATTLPDSPSCVDTMARAKQKSKKASEDIFFEDSALSAETFSKTKGDIYEETDEESRPEKDETEEKLEKLVFGDDEEFQKGLKTYNEQLLRRGSEDVEMGDGEEGAEEEDADDDEKNIEEVDDADVSDLAGSFRVGEYS